jgi:N-methylhydantoinase B
VLADAEFISVADRAILSCWGVKGGKAGKPFRVTIDPGGPNQRVMPGLTDGQPVRAGEVIRIETTGGGGWGDPLDRDPARVALDVLQGKVSREAAAADYGVVVTGDDEDPRVDQAATATLRERLRAERAEAPFFDRGPGYATLSGGAAHAEVDYL